MGNCRNRAVLSFVISNSFEIPFLLREAILVLSIYSDPFSEVFTASLNVINCDINFCSRNLFPL